MADQFGEATRMPPIRPRTAAAQIHEHLRADIVAGRLPPRALLAEAELVRLFGVSRTPIREALIKLADESLVEIYPQYGSFVAPIRLADVYDSQFVREALECAAVVQAVERLDAGQARALGTMLDRQAALYRAGDGDGFFAADEAMHAALMAIAGHERVWRQVASAKAQMDRVRQLAMRLQLRGRQVLDEHAAVIDRVVQRDAAGAAEALRRHLRGLFQSLDILRAERPDYFAEATERTPLRRRGPAPSARPAPWLDNKEANQ